MSSVLKSRTRPIRRSRLSLSVILRGALANWRSRRQLAALDMHLRDDIGVSVDHVKREANRPFWDVPSHWLR